MMFEAKRDPVKAAAGRMRALLQSAAGPSAFKLRLINIGHLVTGNVFDSVLGLIAFILTARALGPADYGVLALTFAYVRAVQLLVSFQSWQPLIKYGAELKGAESGDDYRSLMKFGLLVDLSAAVSAYLVAIAGVLLFSGFFGIGEEARTLVLVYATVLLFQINGLPTAILRLSGRFRLAAYGPLAATSLRLVLCAIGLLTGAGVIYFVCAWAFSQIVGCMIIFTLAMREMRRQGVRRFLSASVAGTTRRFQGLLGFTIGSNLELSVRSSANEFDTLLVGLLAGPTSAGLYHIAKRLGRMVLQLGVQVQAVLYPDLAKLWAQRTVDEFRRTVFQSEMLLAIFGVLLFAGTVLTIRPILSLTAGEAFLAAAPLAVVQMVAVGLTLTGSVTRSALLAMGRQRAVLKVVTVATLVFHATAVVLISLIGPMGANIAHIAMAAVWIAGLLTIYRGAMASAATAPPDAGAAPVPAGAAE